MTLRPGHFAIALATLLIPLLATPSVASVKPSSLGAGAGLGLGLDVGGPNSSTGVLPMVSAGWRLGSRVSLQSSVAYLREETPTPVFRYAFGSSGNLRDLYGPSSRGTGDRTSHFVPLGAGLRLYLKQLPGETGRGLFLEAGPTLSLAWLPYPYPSGGHDAQWLRGVRGALGARFAAMDGTRGEIGVAYYSMERATTSSFAGVAPASLGTGSTRQFDFDTLALYVTFGFGD